MNLIIIAALVAVSSAAKLDRTYLPPASAKSAGGSPGSLQTPFAGNSLNNGLGGLPKGSYTNEFQGVVVNAAAAGTRASESGDSSFGRPRVSYGSTDSKVGDAAFKGNGNQFHRVDGQAAETQGFQSGNLQNQFNQFTQVGSHNLQEGSQNVRPRAELDRNANTVRQESDVGAENYQYGFETDNGITAEESGVAVNGVQAQGGYSYTGDDGQVYSVTYTADEGGFQPKGAHLPTPPPIPEEILKSLEQNARDEAAGLVDDGSYDAQKHNTGGEYTENGANGQYHQSTFGHSETNAAASGSFINQNNPRLPTPSGHSSAQFASSESHTPAAPQGHQQYSHTSAQVGQFGGSQNTNAVSQYAFSNQNQQYPQSSNNQNQQFSSHASSNQNQYSAAPSGNQNVQHSAQFSGNQNQQYTTQSSGHDQYSGNNAQASSSFGQTHEHASVAQPSHQGPQQTFRPSSNTHSTTVSQTQTNSFGNKNEYLPPVSRPQISSHVSVNKQFNAVSTEKAVPLSQQNVEDVSHSQGPATDSFGQTTFTQSIPAQKYSASQPSRPTTFQAQTQQFGSQASQNDYLSPRGQNQASTHAPSAHQEYNSNIQVSGDFQSQPQPKPQGSHTSHTSGSFSQVSSQPQSTNQVNYQGAQFHSTQGSSNALKTQAKFAAQHPTLVPQQELTTPFESRPQHIDAAPSATVASFTSVNSQYANNRPTFNQNNQVNVPAPTSSAAFASFNSQKSFKPQRPVNIVAPSQAPAFPAQSSQTHFNQAQFVRQPQTTQPSQNRITQFASSTAQTFPQQPQAADDSYYYNQPSQPFDTPQSSKFTSTQTSQFDKVNQKPSYSQTNELSSNSFSSQSGQFSGKYPRPPTIAPTLASQNIFNGVTQASVSSFPSEAPTQPTPSGPQFQSRPSYQSNQFSHSQQSYQQPPAVISQSPVTQQSQSFEQHSSHFESIAPSVPSQQQSGEIYEYNKPKETLPAQQHEATASAQFGQKVTKVQGGRQTFNNQFSQSQSAAPQYNQISQQQSQSFGVQRQSQEPKNESPVFGQKTQSFQAIQQKPVPQFNPQTATNPLASTTFNAQVQSDSATSVAGKGEIFGGPRNPPTFDAETGYHY